MTNDSNPKGPSYVEDSPRTPNWSLRFVFGRRLITVAVPPHLLLLLTLIALGGYTLGGRHAQAEQQRQREMVSILKQRNQQLERSLEERESERDQLVELTEAHAQELGAELEDQEREMRRLWSLLGQSEQGPSRLSLSSRSGQRSARPTLSPQPSTAPSSPALAPVRDRYQALRARYQTSRQEMEKLSRATRSYLVGVTPSLAPCKGEMSSGFGYRLHPVYGYQKLHNGCDFTTDHGTPIQATASGTVVRSDWYGGYGKTVEIEHGFGLRTLYAHCDELLVKKGQKVRKGQQIATVGTTGLSSGPHCHYEVHKNGKPVDPGRYLPRS